MISYVLFISCSTVMPGHCNKVNKLNLLCGIVSSMLDSQPGDDHCLCDSAFISHSGTPVPHMRSFEASVTVRGAVGFSMFNRSGF